MTRRRCHRRPGQAQAGNRAARHIAVPHPRVLPPRSRGSTPMPPPLSLEARQAGECYSGCRQGLLAGPNPAASQRVPCQRQCGRVRGGWSRTGGITVGEYRGDRIVFGLRHPQAVDGFHVDYLRNVGAAVGLVGRQPCCGVAVALDEFKGG